MTVDTLARGRELAEQAVPLKLKRLVGSLLALGRVADGEPFVARAVVLDRRVVDLGRVIVRFSRVADALAVSLDGWIVVRVAVGSRLVGPAPGDIALAQRRLRAAGLATEEVS